MDWFKQVLWLLPNWAWFLIIFVIAGLLIAIIIFACVNKGGKAKEEAEEPEPVLMLPDAEKVEESKEKPVKKEEVVTPAEPEPVLMEEPATVKKPAAKTTAKPAAKAEDKPAAKTTAKPAVKTTEKPVAKTTAKPAAKPAEKTDGDSEEVKIYHIARRTDKKWETRLEGGDKALKLFFTQKEAIDYTRKIAGKKRIIVHKETGGNREV